MPQYLRSSYNKQRKSEQVPATQSHIQNINVFFMSFQVNPSWVCMNMLYVAWRQAGKIF